LAQPGEKVDAGIAVGRRHACLKLIIAHRDRRAIADAAIGATGIESERGEPALDFLNLCQRG